MGFFATFWEWLNDRLATYVGDNTARVANVLEPAIVTLGVIYVMMWGYMHLMGKVDEPFSTGLKRIILLAVVFGASLQLWLYNEIIVSTFYEAPSEFAAALFDLPDPDPGSGGEAPLYPDCDIATFGPVCTIDVIWHRGSTVADNLMASGSGFINDLGFAAAAIAVWFLIGWLCVYTMFLIAFASVALSVLLALGPFFIVMLLFESTRGFFMRWTAQLSTYALVIILTTLTAALFLHLVSDYATQTALRGSAILTVDALDMVLVSVLAVLFMMQIMHIAASLSGGGIGLYLPSLSRKAAGIAAAGAALLKSPFGFARGLASKEKPDASWSSSRKAGHWVRSKFKGSNQAKKGK